MIAGMGEVNRILPSGGGCGAGQEVGLWTAAWAAESRAVGTRNGEQLI